MAKVLDASFGDHRQLDDPERQRGDDRDLGRPEVEQRGRTRRPLHDPARSTRRRRQHRCRGRSDGGGRRRACARSRARGRSSSRRTRTRWRRDEAVVRAGPAHDRHLVVRNSAGAARPDAPTTPSRSTGRPYAWWFNGLPMRRHACCRAATTRQRSSPPTARSPPPSPSRSHPTRSPSSRATRPPVVGRRSRCRVTSAEKLTQAAGPAHQAAGLRRLVRAHDPDRNVHVQGHDPDEVDRGRGAGLAPGPRRRHQAAESIRTTTVLARSTDPRRGTPPDPTGLHRTTPDRDHRAVARRARRDEAGMSQPVRQVRL